MLSTCLSAVQSPKLLKRFQWNFVKSWPTPGCDIGLFTFGHTFNEQPSYQWNNVLFEFKNFIAVLEGRKY